MGGNSYLVSVNAHINERKLLRNWQPPHSGLQTPGEEVGEGGWGQTECLLFWNVQVSNCCWSYDFFSQWHPGQYALMPVGLSLQRVCWPLSFSRVYFSALSNGKQVSVFAKTNLCLSLREETPVNQAEGVWGSDCLWFVFCYSSYFYPEGIGAWREVIHDPNLHPWRYPWTPSYSSFIFQRGL